MSNSGGPRSPKLVQGAGGAHLEVWFMPHLVQVVQARAVVQLVKHHDLQRSQVYKVINFTDTDKHIRGAGP